MLYVINPLYTSTLLSYHGIPHTNVGNLLQIKGFNDYNNMIGVNGIFSTNPSYCPIDRTCTIRNPVHIAVRRPWHIPSQAMTLESALAQRVNEIISAGSICNLYWSGGIDSTTMITAFLINAGCLDQIRIMYSPWSTYEHPGYIEWLEKNYPGIELVDISGDVYLDQAWDGVFITGDGGDELTASLDQSFYAMTGHERLHQPWRKYFADVLGSNTHPLIEWYDQYTSLSGRSIETLFQARWWFYAICKADSIFREIRVKMLINDTDVVDFKKLTSFFDCDAILNWCYFNIDSLLPQDGYHHYKIPLKKYCFQHNGFENWYHNKIKHGSYQVNLYYDKKNILEDRRWIAIADHGEILRTPNLPFISKLELQECFANLQIFNDAI